MCARACVPLNKIRLLYTYVYIHLIHPLFQNQSKRVSERQQHYHTRHEIKLE